MSDAQTAILKADHWNYRLTVETCDDETVWAVRELYYDRAGNVTAWSLDPVRPSGDTWRECVDELYRFARVIIMPAYDLDAKQWCDRDRRQES